MAKGEPRVGNNKQGEGKKLIAAADRTELLLSVHAARASPHEVSLVGEPLKPASPMAFSSLAMRRSSPTSR